ncbi:MAG: CopG family antitoxin [Desulfoferrobacter sp.]
MVKDKKLEFETYEQASQWFDGTDLADYSDLMLPVEFSFDLKKNRDLVVLDRDVAKTIRDLARKENVPTRKLVNRLLKKYIEGVQSGS